MRRYFLLTALAMLVAAPAARAEAPHAPDQQAAARTEIHTGTDLHAPSNLLHADDGSQASSQRTNVKLDLKITDTYTDTPSEKTVSMLVLHDNAGMIRTSNRLPNGLEVALNVDAAVDILTDDRVRVRVTFEYTPAQPPADERRGAVPAKLHESLTVALVNGQPLVVSQSADPATDRQVTVELTATILR